MVNVEQLRTKLENIVDTEIGDFVWLMPEDAKYILAAIADIIAGEDAERIWELVNNSPEPNERLKKLLQGDE